MRGHRSTRAAVRAAMHGMPMVNHRARGVKLTHRSTRSDPCAGQTCVPNDTKASARYAPNEIFTLIPAISESLERENARAILRRLVPAGADTLPSGWAEVAADGEHPPLRGAPSLATAQSGKTVWPSCRDPRRAHPADAGSSPWGAADVVTPFRWARRFGLVALLRPAAGRDGRAQYAYS